MQANKGIQIEKKWRQEKKSYRVSNGNANRKINPEDYRNGWSGIY